ncbi:MAG: hypothetical protein K0Q74_734, partial [Gammaproteobacteria bacterium]|nr:hypothetical protein [Gammaproteobacteria bacterium]
MNLIKSLFQWRWVPHSLAVSGLSLDIHEGENYLLEINGIKTMFALRGEENTSPTVVQDFLVWLLQQGDVNLDGLDINWHGRDGMFLSLTDIQLTLYSKFFQRQIIGLATLVQKKPAKLRFVINIKPDFFRSQLISAQGYLRARDVEIEPWMEIYDWEDVSLKQGNLNDVQLWADWQDGLFRRLQSQLKIDHLDIYDGTRDQLITTKNLPGSVAWQRDNLGWVMVARDLTGYINQEAWPLRAFSLQNIYAPSEQTQLLRVDTLDLASLNKTFPFLSSFSGAPNPLVQDVSSIKPSGTLENIILRRDFVGDQPPEISFAAAFKNLSFSSWKKIPGMKNMNGRLKISQTSGSLLLDGENLSIDSDGFFAAPLSLNAYHAEVDWLKTEPGWQVQAEQFDFTDDSLTASGRLNLFVSDEEGQSPFVFLQTIFQEKNAQHLRKYVPIKIFSKALSEWFQQAFVGEGNISGQALLHGPLDKFPYDHQEGRFQVLANTQDMVLSYQSYWPMLTKLSTDLLWNGSRLLIGVKQAEILDIPVKNVSAEIADLGRPELKINANNIITTGEQGLDFITKSPLSQTLGKKLKDIQLAGPIELDLNLLIPFHSENLPLSVKGDITLLSPAKLALQKWGIDLVDLQGAFSFTENALAGDNLSARWLGNPVSINIKTETISADDRIIRINAQGRLSLDNIVKMYSLDALKKIASGAAGYNVSLALRNSKGIDSTTLSMSSDLEGIEVKLPEPFAKKAATKSSLSAQLIFSDKDNNLFDLTAAYTKAVNTSLRFVQKKRANGQPAQWNFDRGEVRFGNQVATLGSRPGLRVAGNLSEINWSNIGPWFSSFTEGSGNKQDIENFPLDQIDLNIHTLKAFGLTLSPINIKAIMLGNVWKINLNNNQLSGWVMLPVKGAKISSIRAEFDRLYLTGDESGDTTSIDPGQLPPLDILLKDFRYGKRHFGRFYFVTSPQKNALYINKASLSSPDYTINGTGLWQRLGNGLARSTISGGFQINDMGSSLREWGVTDSVREGNGKGAFSLS